MTLTSFIHRSLVLTLSVILLSSSFALAGGGGKSKKKKGKTISNPTFSVVENEEAFNVKLQRTFMDAQKAKMLDNLEDALSLFQTVIRMDAKNDVSHYEVSRLYFSPSFGQQKKALEHIEEAVALKPGNKWYQMFYAEVLAADDQYEKAAGIYEKLLEQEPGEHDHYFQRAYFLIQAGKYTEAIAVYDELEQIVGVNDQLIEQKKRLYLRNSDIGGAADELQKLIDANPTEGRYYAKLSELYNSNGLKDKANEVYEQLLEVDPNNPYALLSLAESSRQKGDREKYRDYMLRAFGNRELGIEPKLKTLYPYVEYFELFKDDLPVAIEMAGIMTETHPDESRGFALLGDLNYLMEKPEDARTAYMKAIEADPGTFSVWQQMLFINSDLQDYEELKKQSLRAREYFPNQPILYYFEGVAKHQLKDMSGALKAYDKTLMMITDNPNLEAQVWANMGDVFHELDDHMASDSAYESSLAIDEENPYVLNNYSYYLSLRSEKLDKAAEMSKLANKLVPGNTAFLDTYAWILYQKGDFAKAKEWQEKALESGGNERPVILEHYGDILFQLGEVEAAVEQWKKAFALDSNNEVLSKKIAERKLGTD